MVQNTSAIIFYRMDLHHGTEIVILFLPGTGVEYPYLKEGASVGG
jgi:hypothetical protein